jgi:hypothetical protein
MTALNLLLVLDTLADLLGLLVILPSMVVCMEVMSSSDGITQDTDYTGLGSWSPYVQFEGGSLCVHMLGYSVLRVAMR